MSAGELLRIELAEGRSSYLPGETVAGHAAWCLEGAPASAELRLFWRTEGKGDSDQEIVEALPFAAPLPDDRRPFAIRLPAAPWSFSGKLVSLIWALELVVSGEGAARVEIIVSPTGEELLLHPDAGPDASPR
jgi:hypothetical protein